MTAGFLLLALAADVQVTGGHACPSAAAVKQALAAIAPGIEGRADETARIEEAGGGQAVVRFRTADGTVRVSRPLPVELSCADRARAAAVIIAAHAGAAVSEPVPAPKIGARAAPASPQQPPQIEQHLAGPTPQTTRGPTAISELEVAAMGALGGGGPTPGGRAGVARGLKRGGLLRLSLGYSWTASAPLAAGRFTWSRGFAALGYGHRFWRAGGTTFVEPGAELLASALRLGSEGFAIRETHTVFHPGIAGSVRLGERFGNRVLVWAGVGATVWPRSQRVFLRDVPETARIPRLEAWALLGAGFSTW